MWAAICDLSFALLRVQYKRTSNQLKALNNRSRSLRLVETFRKLSVTSKLDCFASYVNAPLRLTNQSNCTMKHYTCIHYCDINTYLTVQAVWQASSFVSSQVKICGAIAFVGSSWLDQAQILTSSIIYSARMGVNWKELNLQKNHWCPPLLLGNQCRLQHNAWQFF